MLSDSRRLLVVCSATQEDVDHLGVSVTGGNRERRIPGNGAGVHVCAAGEKPFQCGDGNLDAG